MLLSVLVIETSVCNEQQLMQRLIHSKNAYKGTMEYSSLNKSYIVRNTMFLT